MIGAVRTTVRFDPWTSGHQLMQPSFWTLPAAQSLNVSDKDDHSAVILRGQNLKRKPITVSLIKNE